MFAYHAINKHVPCHVRDEEKKEVWNDYAGFEWWLAECLIRVKVADTSEDMCQKRQSGD